MSEQVDVACRAFHQESLDDDVNVDDASIDGDDGVSPREVGHNIYILCHQLAQHDKDLAALLKPTEINADPKVKEALQYYASHTAQIEVRFGGVNSGRKNYEASCRTFVAFRGRLFVTIALWSKSYSRYRSSASI